MHGPAVAAARVCQQVRRVCKLTCLNFPRTKG
jgi:hypothetical protein